MFEIFASLPINILLLLLLLLWQVDCALFGDVALRCIQGDLSLFDLRKIAIEHKDLIADNKHASIGSVSSLQLYFMCGATLLHVWCDVHSAHAKKLVVARGS